jgi:hypothetical protein
VPHAGAAPDDVPQERVDDLSSNTYRHVLKPALFTSQKKYPLAILRK